MKSRKLSAKIACQNCQTDQSKFKKHFEMKFKEFSFFFRLPYCEAIVLESLRAFTFFAMGIAHRAMKDTKLCGFDIPKNTMLISIFNPINRDPAVFKNPNTFDPENFLDANGKLSIPDKFFPFALGKHRCIGEVLAKSNLFLFCTTLIQNFYFDVPSGCEMPSDEPIEGCTPTVKDYEARITLRN